MGGLPLGSWALMALAVLPGLVLVVAARRIHRRGDDENGGPQAPAGSTDVGR